MRKVEDGHKLNIDCAKASRRNNQIEGDRLSIDQLLKPFVDPEAVLCDAANLALQLELEKIKKVRKI